MARLTSVGGLAREFRRGWPALLASVTGAGTGIAPVAAYSIGALVGPLVAEFHWSRADVTGALSLWSAGVALASPVVGWLADRFGARRVALISQLVMIPALASLALADAHLWKFYAGYFLVTLLSAGTLPMIWGRAIVGWFSESRGLALGVSLIGTGTVGALMPSYVSWLTGAYGWRAAYLGMAALPLVFGLAPTILFFREPPAGYVGAKRPSSMPAIAPDEAGHSLGEAIVTPCFWQMSVAFFLAASVMGGILANGISMLVDRGIDRPAAAALTGLFGLAVVAGRLVGGYLLDTFRATRVAAFMFAVSGFACVLLLVAGADRLLCGIAIPLIGLSAGAEYDIAAYLVARYYGRLNFGAIAGLNYTLIAVGGGVGPIAAAWVYDYTGNYQGALAASGASLLLAALMMLALRPPGRPPRARVAPGDVVAA